MSCWPKAMVACTEVPTAPGLAPSTPERVYFTGCAPRAYATRLLQKVASGVYTQPAPTGVQPVYTTRVVVAAWKVNRKSVCPGAGMKWNSMVLVLGGKMTPVGG